MQCIRTKGGRGPDGIWKKEEGASRRWQGTQKLQRPKILRKLPTKQYANTGKQERTDRILTRGKKNNRMLGAIRQSKEGTTSRLNRKEKWRVQQANPLKTHVNRYKQGQKKSARGSGIDRFLYAQQKKNNEEKIEDENQIPSNETGFFWGNKTGLEGFTLGKGKKTSWRLGCGKKGAPSLVRGTEKSGEGGQKKPKRKGNGKAGGW